MQQTPGFVATVRNEAPLISCITNIVTANFVTNVLLALQCAPSVTNTVGQDVITSAKTVDGLLVNLGMAQPENSEQRQNLLALTAAAKAADTPWTLDPVAVGSTPARTWLATELLEHSPTVIRGNASEIMALAGTGQGGKGVESLDSPEQAEQTAHQLAQQVPCVVSVSGASDLITDGTNIVRVGYGDPLLTRITGGGCALGGTVTAFCAVRGDRSVLEATVAAHMAYGVAAERAGRLAAGPGTFVPHFLDSLARLQDADLPTDAAGIEARP